MRGCYLLALIVVTLLFTNHLGRLHASDAEDLSADGVSQDELEGADEGDADASSDDVQDEELASEGDEELSGPFEGKVTRVIDADTILLDGKKVQLLGVNAPERTRKGKFKACYSDDAARYLEALIGDQEVTYGVDRIARHQDKRGIKRIYLYVAGKLVNAELIANGYAFADRSRSYAQKERFLELQAQARLRNLGLWHRCPVECDLRQVCRTKNW